MSSTRSKSRSRKLMAISAALYAIEDCDTEQGAQKFTQLLSDAGYRIVKHSASAAVAGVAEGVVCSVEQMRG